MSKSEEYKTEIKQWIATKNGQVDAADISDHQEILADKLLTSLQVMELILFLEQLSGAPVDTEKLAPGAFKSVNHIVKNFLT